MAKNSIRDYSATNSSNTDIQSIDISEGCSPAGINNAIREVMADLKDVSTGAVALESPSADSLTVTGDLTVDTNTLYVDSTNNNVGIGTSPSKTLHVSSGTYSYPARITSTGGTVTGLEFTNTGSGANPPVVGSKSDDIFFETSNTERLRIDSSGNVGIGQSSPNQKLDVNGNIVTDSYSLGAGNGIFLRRGFETNAQPSITVEDHSGSAPDGLGVNGGDGVSFRTGGTERMRIDSSGNLLVGATSAVFAGATYRAGFKASNNIMAVHRTSGNQGTAIAFINENNVVSGYIYNLTNSTSYSTTSDYRLKTAVTYDWDATTRLKQLKPARFEWIIDGDDAVPVDGFLAHEVQDIVPEAISGTKDGMRDEEYQVSAATGDIYTPAVAATYDEDGVELTAAVDEVIHSTDVEQPEELAEGQQWRETTAAVMGTRSVPDYQGIDQSKLVPLLVKTIQELEARITALEAN